MFSIPSTWWVKFMAKKKNPVISEITPYRPNLRLDEVEVISEETGTALVIVNDFGKEIHEEIIGNLRRGGPA